MFDGIAWTADSVSLGPKNRTNFTCYGSGGYLAEKPAANQGGSRVPTVTVLTCPVCAAPLRPDSSRCDYCRSVVFIQTDHPRIDPRSLNKAVVDEHIAKFRAAVRSDSNDESAHYGLGVAYFNLGLLEEAAEELAQAARLMPENPHIQTQLGIVFADLTKLGKRDAEESAWDRVNRALLLRPDLEEALLLKAKLHLGKREWQEAVAVWQQAGVSGTGSVPSAIAQFLAEYEGLLVQAPKYSASAARAEHRLAARSHRRRYSRYALVSWLVLWILFFVTVGNYALLGLLFFFGGIIVPIMILVYGDRQRRTDEDVLAARWDRLDAGRRELLTLNTVDIARLVEAAKYIVSELQSHDQNASRLSAVAVDQVADVRTLTRLSDTWEYCEIVADSTFGKGLFFVVEVVGPHGRRRIAQHVVGGRFPPKRSTDKYVRKMVDKLVAEGWEPQTKGQDWWSYRFRRPVRMLLE